jgi:hypothetical protein
MPEVSWICGWGVDPQSLGPLAHHYLPKASHAFYPPGASVARSVAESHGVVAWSLGAWHVLNAAAEGLKFRGRVFLLAPFVAFCAEDQLGGRCRRSQVRWLRRWIQRDPQAALGDFYARANLDDLPRHLPYALEDLVEGLDFLERDASPVLKSYVQDGLPAGWKAAIGTQDSLLEAEAIMRILNGCVRVENGTHSAATLLPVFKNDLDAI